MQANKPVQSSKKICARVGIKTSIFCYGNCLEKFAFKIFCIFNICLILSRRAHVFFWNSALVYRPFSNSQGWTGSSMKWRLMRANLFKCKLICPHWPPFHTRSSPAVRIQQWSILIEEYSSKNSFICENAVT